MRDAITKAQLALAQASADDNLVAALAALDQAIALLDASDRQMGAFRGAEPYILVLDPLRQDEPSW